MTKSEWISIINEKFSNNVVIVIGDLMVDEYVVGKVTRISPEAPVPILNYESKSLQAGGASNVANNINGLGAKTYVIGIVGNDPEGLWLRHYMEENGIDASGVIDDNKNTIVKTRFATKGQQLLRMDRENISSILPETQKKIIDFINDKISEVSAVILSDYKKGLFLEESFVREIIEICNEHNVLVAIDSKSRNISAFENADFVKPNNLELEEAVGVKIVDDDSLDLAGKKYLEKSKARALIVTRGAKGISLFVNGKKRKDFEAKTAQVYDVTGAGDTVISTITMGVASGVMLDDAICLANLAAGKVISEVGTTPITSNKLVEKINEE